MALMPRRVVPDGLRRRARRTRTTGSGPIKEVELSAFWIESCAVTNAEFGAFVAATANITEAERFGWLVRLRRTPARRLRAHPGRRVQAPWCATASTVPTAAPGRAALDNSIHARTVRSFTSPGTIAAAYATGRGSGSRLEAEWESARRAAVSSWRPSRGAASSSRAASTHERLAGRLPVSEHARRRLAGHGSSRCVPAERLRAPQPDRERVGVDRGLVPSNISNARSAA